MPISDIPEDPDKVSLRRWRVIEIEAPDGARSRHVWGHDVTNNKGRASSSIVEFNKDAMTATTRSGKIYELVGLPGNSNVGKSAWNKWCHNNNVVSEQDVTNDYLNVQQISTMGFKKFTKSLSHKS